MLRSVFQWMNTTLATTHPTAYHPFLPLEIRQPSLKCVRPSSTALSGTYIFKRIFFKKKNEVSDNIYAIFLFHPHSLHIPQPLSPFAHASPHHPTVEHWLFSFPSSAPSERPPSSERIKSHLISIAVQTFALLRKESALSLKKKFYLEEENSSACRHLRRLCVALFMEIGNKLFETSDKNLAK